MLNVLLNMLTVSVTRFDPGRAAVAEPPRLIIQQLAFLSTARQRLIQAYNLLAVPLAEQATFVDPTLQKALQRANKKSLQVLKEEQKAIDNQIQGFIEKDERLKELFSLMVSVPGIGAATATEILITTNEMKAFTDPKQMAVSAVRLSCRCRSF